MQIKQVPKDFIVTEIPLIREFKGGHYSYFEMEKEGLTTSRAAKMIAQKLGIRLSDVGFAGAKDSRATTKQQISVRKNHHNDLLVASNLNLKYLGNFDRPLSLGELEGNSFELIVRDVGLMEATVIESNVLLLEKMDFFVPNYFDEQRFSVQNVDIGTMLLKKDYAPAVELLQKQAEFSMIKDYLLKYPRDFVGAIRLIPRRQAMLFVHSVQSHLFNEIAAMYLKRLGVECREVQYSRGSFVFPIEKVEQVMLPLPGFGAQLDD